MQSHSYVPVPLTSIDLEINVLQSQASFLMTQNYVNIEDAPIETVFLFPKDSDVAMSQLSCHFTLADGSKAVLETEIECREKAEVKYQDAVASGQTAVIGSYTYSHRDMMRVSIGNFPPNSSAQMVIRYYQNLDIEDMSYCLRVPVGYIPKYMPRISQMISNPEEKDVEMKDEEDEFGLSSVRVEGSDQAPYVWNLRVNIETAGDITRLSSRNH